MFIENKMDFSRFNLSSGVRRYALLCLLICVAVTLSGCPKKGVLSKKEKGFLINRKFVEGDMAKYKSDIEMDTKIRAVLVPLSEPLKIKLSLTNTEEVIGEVADGYWHIVEKVVDVGMKISMGEKVLFDSSNIKEGEHLPEPYTKMLELKNKNVEMEVNKIGQTRNTTGLEGIAASLQSSSYVQMLEMSQIIYPEKPVEIGQEWTEEKDVPMTSGGITGTLKIKDINRLEVVETFMDRKCALVKTVRSIHFDTGDQDMGLIGKIRLSGQGQMDLQYYFDVDEGRLIKTWGGGTFTVKGKADSAPGLGNVTVKINSRMEKVLVQP